MNAPVGPNESETGVAFDYVIVGSGAGGGPLAANLAEAGMRVLLLEAGDASENDDYRVPAFHARASEDPNFSWKYFVQHYQDEQQARNDFKYVTPNDWRNPFPSSRGIEGIFYPRAGTLGGCTAHHALITVYPHNTDFDNIAETTGDPSWESEKMRSYFERLEHFRLPPIPGNGLLAKLSASLKAVVDRFVNPGRHGFNGWLPITFGDPELLVRDSQLLQVILSATEQSLVDVLHRPLELLERLDGIVDPNDWRVATRHLQGLFLVPMSTTVAGQRSGTRERVQEVQRRLPDKLTVRTGALVSRVVLDEAGTARGVDYIDQPHTYRADTQAVTDNPLPKARRVLVRHEVVLACGSFNTPQLLMLSGIGPRPELEKHGIVTAVDLRGVGQNLQEHYEVSVVSEAEEAFALLRDCTFLPPEPGEEPDPCYREFQDGKGVYTTNGGVVSVILKSQRDLTEPDLFIVGLPADFRGYEPDYSKKLELNRNRFTWVILKAHTANKTGEVKLASTDPRATPEVQFNYFGTKDDRKEDMVQHLQELDAILKGIEFARAVNKRAKGAIHEELSPGPQVQTREQLRQFVKDNAFGHHASGTCKMGPAGDAKAVVDSKFRVHGVRGLRVVDASVFPKIPGFFIVAPTYMISEKASDDILEDARAVPPPG